uniref:Uncharacterized protein n=1 Tax=Lactuca sativa TaxID=4236 RepID=A0A9R1WUF5_LACSA|nr:hypothetical protein LSAT_V11C900487940 [Lactuca sativa]
MIIVKQRWKPRPVVYKETRTLLQLIQSLSSSSRHTEISCARFYTFITQWIMDHFHVPIMADSMLSCIGMFHTTNIIVTHPSKFVFVGSIPESISAFEYKKLPSSGPRELTADMVKSIEGTDKPTKRGKNHKKQKSEKAAPAQPKPKKVKKPARRLILQSSSDSNYEYVPPNQPTIPPRESDSESSEDEGSVHGDTPPRSPTSEVPVQSQAPSPPPVSGLVLQYLNPQSLPNLQLPPHNHLLPNPLKPTLFLEVRTWSLIQLTSVPTTSKVMMMIMLELPSTTSRLLLISLISYFLPPPLVITAKLLLRPCYLRLFKSMMPLSLPQERLSMTLHLNVRRPRLLLRPRRKNEKMRPQKSLQVAEQKNSQTVNASVDNLQHSLEAERTNLKVTR